MTTGVVVTCLPAARLFVVRYIPQLTGSILSRASKYTGTQSTELSKISDNSGRGLSHEVAIGGVDDNRNVGIQKLPKDGAEETEHVEGKTVQQGSSLRALDLDRYRRYSMRVTVTSGRRFLSEDDEILALGSPSTDCDRVESPVESVRLPAAFASAEDLLSVPAQHPGDYLGVPEGYLAGTPPTSQI